MHFRYQKVLGAPFKNGLQVSTDRPVSTDERIAVALYSVLRASRRGGLATGKPGTGVTTLVDGTFDLREVARLVVADLDGAVS